MKEYVYDSNGKFKKVVGNNVTVMRNSGEVKYDAFIGAVGGRTINSFDGAFSNQLICIEPFAMRIYFKVGDISDAYELLDSKINNNFDNIYDISRIVLETIEEYFNGRKNTGKRFSFFSEDDSKNFLSNIKGKGAAKCVERAALAQNLLHHLGIYSVYKASKFILNGEESVHSYNLVSYGGKYYLFDATNPTIIDSTLSPIIAEISEEAFEEASKPFFETGYTIKASYYNPYSDKVLDVEYDPYRPNVYDASISKKL